MLKVLLVAAATVAFGCGGSSLQYGRPDAGQDSRGEIGRDGAAGEALTNDVASPGDDSRGPDRSSDGASADFARLDAARDEASGDQGTDANAEVHGVADAGPVDGARPDGVSDASSSNSQDGAATVPDLPVVVDADQRDAGWFDAVPGLRLLAGGLGGSGTEEGTGAVARFCMPTGMVADGRGALYLADYCNHVIRKIVVATGVVTTVAGVAGQGGWADGIGPEVRFAGPAGVASDGQGNLFVTDSGTNLIRKIVLTSGAVTTMAGLVGEYGSIDGTGQEARFATPWAIVFDGAGALYISETGADTIRKLVLGTGAVTTVAGSAGNQGSRDGMGTAAQFADPSGIALDGAGALLIADTANQAIRKLVLTSGEVTTVDRTTFPRPSALASNGNGALYVLDSADMTLRRLVPTTGAVSLVAGDKQASGSDDGIGSAARFSSPAGITLDGAGNAFIGDSLNHVVRKVVLATGAVTTLAGRAPAYGSRDGIGAQARFQLQSFVGLASDGHGHLFVADPGNHTIRKVALATAEVTTLAGSPGHCEVADGVGSQARFCSPEGIASDGNGNLFVSDVMNHAIRKIVMATAEVSTIAGYPATPGSSDGVGAAARFNQPKGITADAVGNVYVADRNNHTIRQIVLASGRVTTVAGSAGLDGSADGVGSAARFSGPLGLVLDGQGSLLVNDRENATIRRITLVTATVTTIAGLAGNQGSEDGVGSEARFSGAAGLALDDLGNLFVADTDNRTVRKIALATAAVTTVVGSRLRSGVVLGNPWCPDIHR